MVIGKEKFALWITPEAKKEVEAHYKQDNCKSQSEYIEKAAVSYTHLMRADHQTVVDTHRFNRKFSSIKQNYMFEPVQSYISASMDILDGEGDHVATYTAFFDFDGNCFDDQLIT